MCMLLISLSVFAQLCHINQQWALDYESLTQNVSPNSTGLHSATGTRSVSPLNCMDCHSLRNQLEDATKESRTLLFKMQRMQSKMDRKDQEINHLESENKAIQMQVSWGDQLLWESIISL